MYGLGYMWLGSYRTAPSAATRKLENAGAMHDADSLTSSGSGKPRILVVEDDVSLCRSLGRLLSDEYTVDTASNGREALSAVLKARPLLVVTDIVMPELDGIGLLKVLRSTRRTQMIPVLLISGHALDEQRIEGFEEGADGYLAKPYTERELRACIGSMLQSARRRDEAARREAFEHATQQALEQLREADRRKNEFLAVLAHELRNPLAPLRNGLHILKLKSDSAAMVSETVSMMDRQMTHLVRLVDDLLDVSRITSGKLELRRRKVLLTEVLESAVEASRAFIEDHGHELVLDLRVHNLWVDGDPDRLAQVFSNLLFNSAKYTERGGRITLSLQRENSETVVTVQDNGIGIPPSSFEEVFDMFSQVRSPEARATEGLGIGLSLARTLVQRHGGSILAFSEGLGKGSRFTVRLPLVEGPVATLDAEVPLPTAHSPGQRVLVVDDNIDAVTSLALLLEMEECEVRTAADGEEAVEQVQAFQPEIIFMDLAMPRLDGVAATRRIRALPQCQQVRIVALTGWGQATDRQRTRDAGMDQHLVKPVSLAALRSVLAATGRV